MLRGSTLFGSFDLVEKAIMRLQAFEPPDGYYLAFSGGKDSQVIYHLCLEAGVRFEPHFHLTTVDPPELIYFIRQHYPGVQIDRPKTTMWNLIPYKGMPPTRLVRYCCSHFKEGHGMHRTVITGIRWQESVKRSKRGLMELNAYSNNRIIINADNDINRRYFETCIKQGKNILNPIIEWTEDHVWEFLRERGLPYCSLYDEGLRRIGCIACPMAGAKGMLWELARWPKYRAAYIRTFDRMVKANRLRGRHSHTWTSGEAVMNWWIQGQKKQALDEAQLSLWEVDEDG